MPLARGMDVGTVAISTSLHCDTTVPWGSIRKEGLAAHSGVFKALGQSTELELNLQEPNLHR